MQSYVHPPAGTVTFLFTDIEGSTVRWERYDKAMRDAVRLHDATMREAIARHHGYVFKTIGDAFCAAFSRPEDAVDATLSAQRALSAIDFTAVDGIRVRMSLHTGTTDERDGDYFGPTVNRVARLLAVAHGGQVILSSITAALVRGSLVNETSLRDLGEHRLKDLARIEHVYQLLGRDLAANFPPLRSLERTAGNLPSPTTVFVGRDREVSQIAALLDEHRFVTIVGSGGIGKTRTLLEVAARFTDRSEDGVWFAELAPLSSGDYIASTIAIAMGLTIPSDGDSTEHLVNLLRKKRAVLVIDNCEHLIEPSARIVGALLRGCDRLKVFASSRQALGIAGEAIYRLPSLSFARPEETATLTAAVAETFSAIALFAARARATDHRFVVTDDNAQIVADICRRLDGIPLAIELAAPRLNMLTLRQLRDRLDERFRVLSGGTRDLLPRQRTLRALIDWSYELLDERERMLFWRLSIFVDGFTIDGAIAVAGGHDLSEIDIFDLLSSLVDKSLVSAEPAEETMRYRMLESTRAYAREKLDGAEERDRCARAHLHFLLDTFVAIDDRVASSGSRSELVAAFASELDDVRAALDFAIGHAAVLGASLLAAQTGAPWIELGLEAEILTRTHAFLERIPEAESRLQARLRHTIAIISRAMGYSSNSLELATKALAFARASGDEPTVVFVALLCAGSAVAEERFDEAEAYLTEAEMSRTISRRARLILLQLRANLRVREGRYAEAITTFESLLAEVRHIGDAQLAMTTTENLAVGLRLAGDVQRSNALLRELLPQLRMQKNRISLQSALNNLSQSLVLSGETIEALAICRELVALHASIDPLSAGVTLNIEMIAWILEAQGASQRAALLSGYATATGERMDLQRDPSAIALSERMHTQLALSLPPADLERLVAEGAMLSPAAAIALALEGSSEVSALDPSPTANS